MGKGSRVDLLFMNGSFIVPVGESRFPGYHLHIKAGHGVPQPLQHVVIGI